MADRDRHSDRHREKYEPAKVAIRGVSSQTEQQGWGEVNIHYHVIGIISQ